MRLSASREEGRRGLLIAEIDGLLATTHPAARLFIDAGFIATAMGLQLRPTMTDHKPRSRGDAEPTDTRNS